MGKNQTEKLKLESSTAATTAYPSKLDAVEPEFRFNTSIATAQRIWIQKVEGSSRNPGT